jgi:linoleoyl-CoA desaturase
MTTTTTAASLHYAPAGAFHADLKRAVDGYFVRTGRSPRGGLALGVQGLVLLTWLGGSWALLVFAGPGPVTAVLLAISTGLAVAGVGFGVMHDANHGASSGRRWLNRLLAYSVDLIGGSSYLWRQRHNLLHHTWPNVAGLDADGDAGAFLRLAPTQPLRWAHRWQWLYAWPLYGIFALKWWVADDWKELASGRVGGHAYARPRGRELAFLLLGKLAFYGWAIVVPFALHPTLAALGLWLLASATAGVVLSTVFQLAHCVEDTAHPDARGGLALGEDWAAHQVRATVDFARGNRLLGWYVGGLNFQVEHHLFPKVSHVHYRALSPLVEEVCRAHGVPFQARPTLRAAVAANLRWLRALGRLPVVAPRSGPA